MTVNLSDINTLVSILSISVGLIGSLIYSLLKLNNTMGHTNTLIALLQKDMVGVVEKQKEMTEDIKELKKENRILQLACVRQHANDPEFGGD